MQPKMKKYISIFAFALLAGATTFTLSACGGDDDDDAADAGGSQEQTDDTLTPEGRAAVAIDLGLPSGTLWADRNVGADKAEATGDFFAWGETEPKSNYDWSTYTWGTAMNQLTKYCDDGDYGKNGYSHTRFPVLRATYAF